MLNISIAILLLTGFFPLIYSFKNYFSSKDSRMLVLFLWFAARSLEVLTGLILIKAGQRNLFAFSYFSIVIETILMIGLAQLSLDSKSKIWFILYLVPIQILFYQGLISPTPLVKVSRFEINIFYYAISSILLLILIFKKNTKPHFLSLFQLLLIYHMAVFFYAANLELIRQNHALMDLTYPFFLAVVAIFNLWFAYLLQKNKSAFQAKYRKCSPKDLRTFRSSNSN